MSQPQSPYGIVPPQAVEVEKIVLGTILTIRDSISLASTYLTAEDFYMESNQNIFQAAMSLHARTEAIDLVTVLKESKRLGLNVDAVYLAELTSRVGSSAHLDSHCKILKEQSIRRQVITEAMKSSKDAYDDTVDPFELINSVELSVTRIKESILKGKRTTKEQIVENLITRMKRGDTIGYNMTGIPEVDRIVGKVEPGELIIVAGRPGMGKSMFANTICRHLAVENNLKVLLWALEMTSEQNMRRIIANLGDIDYNELKKGRADFDKIEPVISRIVASSLQFEDISGVTALDIRSRLISQQRGSGLDFAIIDHGGLMNNLNGKNTNEVAEISKTTRLIKQTAKDLHIPIVMLWQLNREVEKRSGCVPRLSDLRDSGSLEQDADKVIFLYRPEYYGLDAYNIGSDSHDAKGLAVAMVEKNREGELGRALMTFRPQHMRFEPWRDHYHDDTMKADPEILKTEIPF